MAIQNRIKIKYDEQVKPVLMKEFNYSALPGKLLTSEIIFISLFSG